jgi:hypothetical protein
MRTKEFWWLNEGCTGRIICSCILATNYVPYRVRFSFTNVILQALVVVVTDATFSYILSIMFVGSNISEYVMGSSNFFY